MAGVSSTTRAWALTFSRLLAPGLLFKILVNILTGAETGPQNCTPHQMRQKPVWSLSVSLQARNNTSSWLEKLGGDSRTASGAKHVGLPPTELSLSQAKASPWSSASSRAMGRWLQLGARGHRTRLHHAQLRLGTSAPRPHKRSDTGFTSTC